MLHTNVLERIVYTTHRWNTHGRCIQIYTKPKQIVSLHSMVWYTLKHYFVQFTNSDLSPFFSVALYFLHRLRPLNVHHTFIVLCTHFSLLYMGFHLELLNREGIHRRGCYGAAQCLLAVLALQCFWVADVTSACWTGEGDGPGVGSSQSLAHTVYISSSRLLTHPNSTLTIWICLPDVSGSFVGGVSGGVDFGFREPWAGSGQRWSSAVEVAARGCLELAKLDSAGSRSVDECWRVQRKHWLFWWTSYPVSLGRESGSPRPWHALLRGCW